MIQLVKEKREKAGLSQAELAFRLDVAPGFIGMVESPRYPQKYNIDHISELAKIFDCSPKDFIPDVAV